MTRLARSGASRHNDRPMAAADQAMNDDERRMHRLLAVLAHDLRNPLSPIFTAAELMRRSEMTPQRVESISGMLARQVGQLTRLIDELQQWALNEGGRLTLASGRMDLTAALRTAESEARAAVEARGAMLQALLPDEPLWVHGDSVRIAQAVSCVLHSAARHARNGSLIQLKLSIESSGALIVVVDDGEAIDAGLLAHAFDAFADETRAPARRPPKLGLGMSLARSIVERHGGRVEAHTTPDGTGAEVVLRLPRGPL